MVDNVVVDDVEPKPAKNEAFSDAFGVGSSDVKPTVNVKPFKVKISFQVRISKIEEPKPVPIRVVCKVRDTASFFYNKCKMERARRVTWLGSSTRVNGRIYCLYR